MRPARGGTVGVCGAKQHTDIIDVCSGAPVTDEGPPPAADVVDSVAAYLVGQGRHQQPAPTIDFPRPRGAVVVNLRPFLEHESETRAHLLQLVIDAASVPEPDRPRGLTDHIARLWRAVEQLVFTDGPSRHRRLVADPAADTRRRTVENFLTVVDQQPDPPRVVPVDRLREPIAVIDKCLERWPGGMVPGDARRTLDLVRAELVALVAP